MKPANDNAPDPFAKLNEATLDNPCQMFGIQPELLEYLVYSGSVNRHGGLYTYGNVADALEVFRSSHLAELPIWRLYAEYDGEEVWKAAQRLDAKRWSLVYFLDGHEAVKIGTSICPEDRLRTMQTGNWRELALIGKMPGGELTETALHEKFSDLRIRGEWYRKERPILDFIAENCGDAQEVAA